MEGNWIVLREQRPGDVPAEKLLSLPLFRALPLLHLGRILLREFRSKHCKLLHKRKIIAKQNSLNQNLFEALCWVSEIISAQLNNWWNSFDSYRLEIDMNLTADMKLPFNASFENFENEEINEEVIQAECSWKEFLAHELRFIKNLFRFYFTQVQHFTSIFVKNRIIELSINMQLIQSDSPSFCDFWVAFNFL